MLVSTTALTGLYTGFKGAFQEGMAGAPSLYAKVATTVNSATLTESYGWLKDSGEIREWVGDRVINNMATAGYELTNLPWEKTIGVDRDRIEDDQYGIYKPSFAQMGFETARFPDVRVFPLLNRGFNAKCFDGKPFFSDIHPGKGRQGEDVVRSNVQMIGNSAGTGAPWFLADLSRPLKPLIFQNRKMFSFVAKTSPTDENVFMRKEFLYGVDGRAAFGYGFWNTCFASRHELSFENFATLWAAMSSQKREDGGEEETPLGIVPTHLIVPPTLFGLANIIAKSATVAMDGVAVGNPWAGAVEVMMTPYLA